MSQLKIYSEAPNGNQAADLEHAIYMNRAIKEIKEESERMKTLDKPIQIMLAHIDILLYLSRKFMKDAHLLIKKAEVKDWKTTFDEWFERCQGKIPAKFRDGIRQSADDLFTELGDIAR
jgi:hypothetical protein